MSRRHRRFRTGGGTEINMAPLIDMIFILLIFFLVSTSFVREAGIEVERPVAETASDEKAVNVVLAVDAGGRIHLEGRTLDIRSVRPYMERFVAEEPNGAVIVAADRSSRTGVVVEVLDACRLAGVANVSVAAQRP